MSMLEEPIVSKHQAVRARRAGFHVRGASKPRRDRVPGRLRAVLPVLTLTLPHGMRCHIAAVLDSRSGRVVRLCATVSGFYANSPFHHVSRSGEQLSPMVQVAVAEMAKSFVTRWAQARDVEQLTRPHLGIAAAPDRVALGIDRRGPLLAVRLLAQQIARGRVPRGAATGKSPAEPVAS